MTFLELFASLYLSPQEVASEAGVPLEVVLNLRNGKPARERDIRHVLRVINARREKPLTLKDIPAQQILWE
jgi:hypothetical protein